MSIPERHTADCTIYSSMINRTPLDGICTCGYGWSLVAAKADYSQMFSKEREAFTDDAEKCWQKYYSARSNPAISIAQFEKDTFFAGFNAALMRGVKL